MPLVASDSVIAKPSLTSTTDLVLDRIVQRPDDAVRCYDMPIETLRDRYLNERLEGETAAQKDV